MTPRIPRYFLPFMFAAAAAAAPAQAGTLADLDLYDRSSGRVLPLYSHDGRWYAPGEPGHEYELRLRNRSGGRLLTVISVDGVNVLSGSTASTNQGGYVLDPYESASIAGWRKSMERIAAFYFTSLSDSYAARTGRPDNVGVIGVALFREKRHFWKRAAPCCARREDESSRQEPAPEAKSEAGAAADAAPPATAQPSGELREKALASSAAKEAPLGTGHGRSERSVVAYTPFERASETPDEVLTICYDSVRNLVARGIIPEAPRYARRDPNPFPGGFVPDP